MPFMVPLFAIRRGLRAGLLFFALAGVSVELAIHTLGVDIPALRFFGLSYEGNLPTWYAASLLLTNGLLLLWIGVLSSAVGERFRRHWTGLGCVFLYLSLDEAVELHEAMSDWWPYGGVLYFSWILPAAMFVAILGWIYLPFLRDLSPATRLRFVLAGSMYVGGALILELPLGWWTERNGSNNLIYGLIDAVEESLELAGASLFLYALAVELSIRGGSSVPDA